MGLVGRLLSRSLALLSSLTAFFSGGRKLHTARFARAGELKSLTDSTLTGTSLLLGRGSEVDPIGWTGTGVT